MLERELDTKAQVEYTSQVKKKKMVIQFGWKWKKNVYILPKFSSLVAMFSIVHLSAFKIVPYDYLNLANQDNNWCGHYKNK